MPKEKDGRCVEHWLKDAQGNPRKFTVSDAQALVRHVRKASEAPDAEVAHSREDTAFVAVLEAIANGQCVSPQECAREVLKSRRISFGRYTS